ncbi:hypothetical protein V1477_001357 [Vespula maculifrons]|uniref:Uncharacterized protein n=1 Tax=Vespula maculifrons TaxID=7453 RepID=A0ABD2CZ10_VESMC
MKMCFTLDVQGYIIWWSIVELFVSSSEFKIPALGTAFVLGWFSVSLKKYKIHLRKPFNCSSNCIILKNKFCYNLLSDIKYLFRKATNNNLDITNN